MPTYLSVGHGCRIVPFKAVALNGVVVAVLEIEANDTFALILPDGKAAMCGESRRPYRYESEREAREDAEVICKEETNDAPPGAGDVGSDRAGGVPGGAGFTPAYRVELVLYREAERVTREARHALLEAAAEWERVTGRTTPMVRMLSNWTNVVFSPRDRARWSVESEVSLDACKEELEACRSVVSAGEELARREVEYHAAAVALADAVSDHTFRAEDIEKNGRDENDPTLKTKG